MGGNGARGKGTGASPVSYRHNFLVFEELLQENKQEVTKLVSMEKQETHMRKVNGSVILHGARDNFPFATKQL